MLPSVLGRKHLLSFVSWDEMVCDQEPFRPIARYYKGEGSGNTDQ